LSETLSPTIDPPEGREHRREVALGGALDRLTGQDTSPHGSPTKEKGSPFDGDSDPAGQATKRTSSAKASPSSEMQPRNSPLSWQRRPNSQASDRPRTRPLSIVATENAARSPRATPEPSPVSSAEPTLSREQIAQSLASKDPAWFRQTADRGASSPAYRRNQVEDEDRLDHGSNSVRVQMPGMSREASMETSITDTPDRSASSSPTRSSAGLQQGGSRSSGFGSPVPLTSAQRFDPPNIDSMSEARGLAMSPSQGRISPERLDRPPSPTKGMGGFVQSAMMKRSDSVNKRWSVQSPPGLNRGNSIASNRSTHDSSAPLGSIVNSSGASRPDTMSRDNSPRPPSRPTSSHSNATITQDGRPGTSSSMRSSITASTDKEGFVKPGLPASHSQTLKNTVSGEENTPKEKPAETETTPPSSPSKTMDSRRWSPTKASWLESALNKPDSPKPKAAAAPPQQPSWMAEINKAKTRGSVDLGRSPVNTPKHDVNIGGLMRSPAPGSLGKPIGMGAFPVGSSSGTTARSRPESEASQISPLGRKAPPITSPKPSPAATFPPSNSKPKPETPLKNDFRANLKPRQLPAGSEKEEPEFKNVFGQLRRTKTQNYVAPDELKGNITRGKAALNITGGPKKTERVDEFKEAILKKKEDFKKAQLEGKGVTKPEPAPSQVSDIPEALAKRRDLGKVDPSATQVKLTSTGSPSPAQELPRTTTPKQVGTPPLTQAKDALGGKLAGRFNPALAGLLARGPPSAGNETSRSSSSTVSHRTTSTSTSATVESSEPGPQLTHMTKARARGPRRKAPSGIPSSVTTTESVPDTKASPKSSTPHAETTETIDTNTSRIQSTFQKTSTPSLITTDSLKSFKHSSSIPSTPKADIENAVSSQPSSPNKLDLKRRSQFLQDSPNKSNKGEPKLETPKPLSPTKKANAAEIFINTTDSKPESTEYQTPKPRPATPAKSPSLKSRSPTTERPVDSPKTAKFRPSPLSPKKFSLSVPVTSDLPNSTTSNKAISDPLDTLYPTPSLPKKTNIGDLISKGSEISVPENGMDRLESTRTQATDPSPSVRNAAAMWDRPLANVASQPSRARSPIKLPTHDDEKAALIGAGLRSLSPVKTEQMPKSASPTARQLPVPALISPIKANSPVLSQSAEASKLVTDFFEPHESAAQYVTDTAELLNLRPDRIANVKTVESVLYQFPGDGKKYLVPSHQERLLFEGSMYICIHNFETSTRRKVTEVYFWIGDEVPVATAEDANIYARREARQAGGSLVKIQQGKETSEFIQALGGIVIIRRGSLNKYDSLSPHILCARKHLGQIVFDEVDYSPASLCSGFPYLISTQSGRCFLWKGRGSGIEELGCARLIGMDFGVMGDIEEVEEGQEPASFLQVFGNGTKIPQSANHWKMKPNYDKYCARLFCAKSTAKSQVSCPSL